MEGEKTVKVIRRPQVRRYVGNGRVAHISETSSGKLIVNTDKEMSVWDYRDQTEFAWKSTNTTLWPTTVVDEECFVTCKKGKVKLHIFHGSRFETRFVFGPPAAYMAQYRVKVWRTDESSQQQELMIVYSTTDRSQLAVWSLGMKDKNYDIRFCTTLRDVKKVFGHGLYLIGDNEVRNYFDDSDVTRLDCSSTGIRIYKLIRLSNRNFVTTSSAKLVLWSGVNGGMLRVINNAHLGDRIVIKKRKIQGGFLSGCVDDMTIRGWNEDGDCLFICYNTHQQLATYLNCLMG